MDKKYIDGNEVGVVEGLEMAALYHERLAEKQLASALWRDGGTPNNGCAIYVEAQRKYAAEIRAMKTRHNTC